jgi:hypothetical protein
MADSHLTVPHSPQFPQPFSGAIGRLVARVDQVIANAQLSTCSYDDEFASCQEQGTVHRVSDDLPYCVRHFWAVSR